ncbi:Uncharacterised protein [Mycobacterium tuberculosis]|nr:Uncharacterised protein [Mycobacterium tuberculosis]
MDAPFASSIAQPAPATPMPMMAMNSTSKMQVTTVPTMMPYMDCLA